MRSWAIRIGRVFGIELRIHLTFLFLVAFVWLTESAPSHHADPQRVLALVGVIFGCVLLHELGHALVSIRAGIRPKAIILLPIGGVTLLDETRQQRPQLKSWNGILIALAGPLMNLLAAFIAAAILLAVAPEIQLWAKPYVHSNHLARSLVWSNIWLALFNLLPA